jgi:hypothetical protein
MMKTIRNGFIFLISAFLVSSSLNVSVNAKSADDVFQTEISENKSEETKLASGRYNAMFRMYNPNSGEHFYTSNADERGTLLVAGWRYEGISWNSPEGQGSPVYRLYNPNAGDHFYTTSKEEKDHLVDVGWRFEGIGWYSDSDQGLTVYRLYNPNAVTGAHHYTTSTEERDHLVSVGWRYEGTAWYGVYLSVDENTIYQPVLQEYYYALNHDYKFSDGTYMNTEFPWRHMTVDDTGYSLIDLNNDGIQELVICEKDDENNRLFDMNLYTINPLNGEAEKVFESWTRASYQLIESGMIQFHGSGSAAINVEAYYSFDPFSVEKAATDKFSTMIVLLDTMDMDYFERDYILYWAHGTGYSYPTLDQYSRFTKKYKTIQFQVTPLATVEE